MLIDTMWLDKSQKEIADIMATNTMQDGVINRLTRELNMTQYKLRQSEKELEEIKRGQAGQVVELKSEVRKLNKALRRLTGKHKELKRRYALLNDRMNNKEDKANV